MQSAAWVALLKRLPPNQCNNLMLVTNNGIEMSIQAILRVEDEYLVLRARMSGTDTGRIIFIPFANLTYLGFAKPIKDHEVRAMFGEVEPEPEPAATAETTPEPEAGAPPVPVNGSADATPQPAPEAAEPPKAPAPVLDKKTMLERLRARASFAGTIKSPLNR